MVQYCIIQLATMIDLLEWQSMFFIRLKSKLIDFEHALLGQKHGLNGRTSNLFETFTTFE